MAKQLIRQIEEKATLFHNDHPAKGGPLVIFIFDRREDPVTPFLNQWTYQAMIHELVGLEMNCVSFLNSQKKETIVMTTASDPFYRENRFANFGDLGVNVKSLLRRYQDKTKTSSNLESIEEMQKFVDEYPEFRQLASNVSKHVSVLHHLSRIVETHELLRVSSLEQELSCTEVTKNEILKKVANELEMNITNIERLRLVILFALRFEGSPEIRILKSILTQHNIDQSQIDLIDTLIHYAGKEVRSGDVFQNKDFITVAKNVLQRGFRGVPNVYTQHTSLLSGLVDNLIKGKLSTSLYPIVHSYPQMTFKPNSKPATVLIYVTGGITLEEYRDMVALSKTSDVRILCGGSCVHNMKTFLADMAQLNQHHYMDPSLIGSPFKR